MPRQRKTEYVEVEGTDAVIFQRETTWYMRIRLPGTGEYRRESCKTKNLEKARRLCQREYDRIGQRTEDGIPVTRQTIATLAVEMLKRKETEHQAGQLSGHMLTLFRCKAKPIIKYWDKRGPADVTKASWRDYIMDRLQTGKSRYAGNKLSPATLKHERMTMQAVLDIALEYRLITHVPVLWTPPRKQGSGIRPTFQQDEIDRLELYLAERASYPEDRFYREKRNLFLYTQILRHTGLRTNDMKKLRRRDVEVLIRPNDGEKVLFIRATGKGKDRQVVSQPEAVYFMNEVFSTMENKDPDALVFSNEKGTGPKRFDKIFRRNLKAAGLLNDRDGKPRSPYCLRHFYAMSKVNRNVPPLDIADNMGCGIPVLSRYYAAHSEPVRRLAERSA